MNHITKHFSCLLRVSATIKRRFFSEFIPRKSQKLEIKILLNEKIKRKSKNCVCIRFRTMRIVWDRNPTIWLLLEEGSACRSLGQVYISIYIPRYILIMQNDDTMHHYFIMIQNNDTVYHYFIYYCLDSRRMF